MVIVEVLVLEIIIDCCYELKVVWLLLVCRVQVLCMESRLRFWLGVKVLLLLLIQLLVLVMWCRVVWMVCSLLEMVVFQLVGEGLVFDLILVKMVKGVLLLVLMMQVLQCLSVLVMWCIFLLVILDVLKEGGSIISVFFGNGLLLIFVVLMLVEVVGKMQVGLVFRLLQVIVMVSVCGQYFGLVVVLWMWISLVEVGMFVVCVFWQ